MSTASTRLRGRPLLLVGAGGFAGAVARHAVTRSAPALEPDALARIAPELAAVPGPLFGTLVVNVVGCFALGLVVATARERGGFSRASRRLVGTGFLSSFTTYSAFAHGTATASPALAVANVAANYALGFSAVLLAVALVRWRS